MHFPSWLQWFAKFFDMVHSKEALWLSVTAPISYEILYFLIVLAVYRKTLRAAVFNRVWIARDVVSEFRTEIAVTKRHLFDTLNGIHDNPKLSAVSYLAVALFGGGMGVLWSQANWLLALIVTVVFLVMSSQLLLRWHTVSNWYSSAVGESNRVRTLRRIQCWTVGSLVAAISVAIAVCMPWLSGEMRELTSGGTWPHLTSPEWVLQLEYCVPPVILLAQVAAVASPEEIPNGIYLGLSFLVGAAVAINHLFVGIDRIHHDFLGIVLQVFPINSVRFLGVAFTIDAMLYRVDPSRRYDFVNVVVDNPAVVVTFLLGAIPLQVANWLGVRFLKASKKFGNYQPITDLEINTQDVGDSDA